MPQPIATVISPEYLLARLEEPKLGLVEINSLPAARNRTSGVIPGSRVVYWKDFAWDESRRLLAPAEEFSYAFFQLGIGEDSTVILYGDPTQFAAYVVWALRVRGFENIAYLDGGVEAWKALRLPTSDTVTIEREKALKPLAVPVANDAYEKNLIGRDGVLASLEAKDALLLDFRSPEEYSGERVSGKEAPIDHGAERHGRIPGARHFYFRELLDEIGRFKPADEIRALAEKRGVFDAGAIINYCRLAHRSTLGWLALTEVLGLKNVRVYDGSWTEWGSIVGVPIEK